MTDATLHADKEWLLHICKGDEHAASFLLLFFAVCHLWDDLIDKDKPRSDDDINQAFWMALIQMPTNRYYRDCYMQVHPVMAVAIQEWLTANRLEKNQREDIAFTLRCSIVSLIHQAAEICGGYEWAIEVGEEIRLRTQSETFHEYLEDLKNA